MIPKVKDSQDGEKKNIFGKKDRQRAGTGASKKDSDLPNQKYRKQKSVRRKGSRAISKEKEFGGNLERQQILAPVQMAQYLKGSSNAGSSQPSASPALE